MVAWTRFLACLLVALAVPVQGNMWTLMACLALCMPVEGILFLPGQGKSLVATLLVAWPLPGQGTNYLAWWRLREHNGRYWFVWLTGYWEELSGDWEEVVDALFEEEPEMAAFCAGMSAMGGEVSEWPPTWHIPSQMWAHSRLKASLCGQTCRDGQVCQSGTECARLCW